ncbi:MAG: hypothetical protein ACREKK_05535 [Candidatus Methylomirabilales bacterium]
MTHRTEVQTEYTAELLAELLAELDPGRKAHMGAALVRLGVRLQEEAATERLTEGTGPMPDEAGVYTILRHLDGRYLVVRSAGLQAISAHWSLDGARAAIDVLEGRV